MRARVLHVFMYMYVCVDERVLCDFTHIYEESVLCVCFLCVRVRTLALGSEDWSMSDCSSREVVEHSSVVGGVEKSSVNTPKKTTVIH